MNNVATELGERTKELVFRAHDNAKKHGFHDKKIDLEQAVMLIVSEVGEAIEAHRIGRYAKIKPADTWAIATQSQFEFHVISLNIGLEDLYTLIQNGYRVLPQRRTLANGLLAVQIFSGVFP